MRFTMSRRTLALIAAATLAATPSAVAGPPDLMKLQYAGYLADAQVLDMRVEIGLGDDGPYRMTLSGSLVGALGNLFQFRMKAASQGLDGARGPRPRSYRSEISIQDSLQTVSLSYRPDGSVLLKDEPPTQEGRAAVAGGLLAGTMDPLSAALAIVEKVSRTGSCAGRYRIFDGVRRYDLALGPAPAGLAPPRLPAAPDAQAVACDAAITLRSGFPRYAVEAGMYPSSARFWLARDVIGTAPALLRVEAESGLGRLRLDLRAILP